MATGPRSTARSGVVVAVGRLLRPLLLLGSSAVVVPGWGCARDGASGSLLEQSENRDVELDGETKRSITPAFPARLAFEVDVPAQRPVLSFSIATLTSKRAERARVEFRIVVDSRELPVTVFRRSLRVHEHNAWHDAAVRLDAWAGKRVTLRLETSPTRSRLPVPWADRIQTLWGEPVLKGTGAVEKPERPSTILIVVDTLRYDYLGVHGFEGEISPSLDWLALESMRFDNAFSNAPWTKPSVASLLTGLHPQTHGVRDHGGKLRPHATDTLAERAVTLAEVFQQNGYHTAAFVGNSWLAPGYGFDQGFDTYVVDPSDERLLATASDWLGSSHVNAPYFLYLHLIGVHGPYRAPESDYLALRKSPSLGLDRAITASDPRRPGHLNATPWSHPGEDESLSAWRAKYAATVRKIDRQLGGLIAQLRSSGELDRARVVFTSDHGEEFLEHGSWEHGYSLCDHQIRVPLWIREPGAPNAGKRVQEVVSLVDVMSTVLGLSSIQPPASLQGTDRSYWILGPRNTLHGGTAVSTGILNRPDVYSLRTRRYHLLWNASKNAIELFNVAEDPDENEDVARSEPVVAERLHRILQFRLDRISSAGMLTTRVLPVSMGLRERLRALGYFE